MGGNLPCTRTGKLRDGRAVPQWPVVQRGVERTSRQRGRIVGEGAKKSAFPDKRPKLQSERRLPAWPWRNITHKFFKTLFNWLQGLSEIRLGFTPLLEDGFYLEPANQAMLKYPLAIVNVKKIFSGASVGNLTLREYAGRDAAFIRWQVRGILSPNIVVCGSGSGSLLNIAEESIYPDLTFSPINSWCHYCAPPNCC